MTELDKRNVWVVREEDDEGRKNRALVGIFSTEQADKTAGVGRGAWGSNTEGVLRAAIVVDNIAYIVEAEGELDVNLPEAEEKLRESALAKLTPEERAVLRV